MTIDAKLNDFRSRACFEAAAYDRLVDEARQRVFASPWAALWSARAAMEVEEFELAESILLAAIKITSPGVLRGDFWAQIALVRLIHGRPLDAIDAALQQAESQRDVGAGALVRCMMRLSVGELAEADAGVSTLPPFADPYFEQLRLNLQAATASSLADDERTHRAIAAFETHLERNAGLHYLGWSFFSVARAQSKRGWLEQGRTSLDDLDSLFAIAGGRRLRRAAGLLREALDESVAIEFCPLGKNHCAEVPRNFETSVAARTHLPPNLTRRPVLAQLYSTLLAVGDAGMTKDDLFRHLWGSSYDPLRHEARLYKSLARLREALQEHGEDALVAVGARYLIKSARRVAGDQVRP